MTREEASNKAMLIMKQYGNWMMDLGTYPDSLEALIDKIYDDFEQQNKALTDMVEMLTEKIKRLEEPKSCEVCKYFNILTQDGVLSCGVFGDIRSEVGFEYNFSCNKYAPKETK